MILINKKTLVIIAGARRGIGRPFFNHFKKRKHTECIGISRKIDDLFQGLDLLNIEAVNSFVEDLDLSKIDRLVYFHSVGCDKFEPDGKPHIDEDGDGIDDEVFKGNVTAFLNVIKPLLERVNLEKIPTKIINIGSVSDVMQVPFWQSFTRSKNIVRGFMKANCSDLVQSIVLNVSSTIDYDDPTRKYDRPYADTTYWQTSMEFFHRSLKYVETRLNANYVEMDFFKPNPNFREDYFTNLDELYKQYQEDMGYVGKKIPHGLRI